MEIDLRLNEGWRWRGEKLFGVGFTVWNDPWEIYIELFIWCLNIKGETK